MKRKGQKGAGMRGRQWSCAGARGARSRGFSLTINDAVFKGRTERPQSSQSGHKSWRKHGLVKW